MIRAGYMEWIAAIVVAGAIAASWNDYRRHRVPNLLNAAILLAGLFIQSAFFGWSGLQQGLWGVAVGAGPLFILWMMKAIGAGDVKFMGALGACLGPHMTLNAVVVGGLVGGVMAIAMLAAQRNWRQTSMNMGVLVTKMSSLRTAFGEFGSVQSMCTSGGVMPYAIPLSIGSLVVVFANYFGWWKVL
ncbi:MAG TPA: A24 family peptidase [Phycisphaerae bacterium]|nr:A24 family peptidase [Phycisphaerae bacterium]